MLRRGYNNGMADAGLGFFISTGLVYHGTYTINSLSHVFGRQRYKTGDASRNNPWLAIITSGRAGITITIIIPPRFVRDFIGGNSMSLSIC